MRLVYAFGAAGVFAVVCSSFGVFFAPPVAVAGAGVGGGASMVVCYGIIGFARRAQQDAANMRLMELVFDGPESTAQAKDTIIRLFLATRSPGKGGE